MSELEEIVRSLGGRLCRCSPTTNGHMPGPIGPAGSCPDCGFEGPFYRQAIEHYQATHNGHSPNGDVIPLTATDLSVVLAQGVKPPVLLCEDMLYEGGLHSIAGAPDSGKTTIGLWWAFQLIQEGRKVLFLDEEGGPEIVTERMAALGANPGHLRSLTYVAFPGRRWIAEDVAALIQLVEMERPAMVLLDSSAAFMARAGLDENQAGDVTSFWSRVLTPLARDSRVAVLCVDHDTKATEQSRYARGSGAKLAAIDVQMKVEIIKPFTRREDGILKLHVSKDRRGWLHRDWRVNVTTGGEKILPAFTEWEDAHCDDADMAAWPPARQSIYQALDSTPRTQNQVVDRIVQAGRPPLRRETASTHLNELARDGLIIREEHPGFATRWSRN